MFPPVNVPICVDESAANILLFHPLKSSCITWPGAESSSAWYSDPDTLYSVESLT